MKTLYCLLFISFFITGGVYSQEKKPVLITGDFRGITIDEFVRHIEAKTSYHFFYDPSHYDLLIISAEVKDKSLEEVLSEIFKNSDYNFFIDKERVFLTKAQVIKTDLPPS